MNFIILFYFIFCFYQSNALGSRAVDDHQNNVFRR